MYVVVRELAGEGGGEREGEKKERTQSITTVTVVVVRESGEAARTANGA